MDRAQLVGQLHQLGVKQGSVLVVHTSFRAIQPVEGGPGGLIDALLEAIGPDGTLVMPSMTDLLGVDHSANTTIHLAEVVANVPYGIPKYCTVIQDGAPVRVDYLESDHCCRNFNLVGEWLEERGLERKGRVGSAMARLMSSRALVETVVAELRSNPCRFLCPPGTGCHECDAAWESTKGGS